MRANARHSGHGRRHQVGFTLIELLVVMGAIMLLLLLALPNIRALLDTGSYDQARAAMSGALAAARAVALDKQQYALLHVQSRDIGDDTPGEYQMAILYSDPDHGGRFDTVQGYQAMRLPRDIGAGEVNDRNGDFIKTDGTYDGTKIDSDDDWKNFTAFNVIFAPDGSVVTDIDGSPADIWNDRYGPFGTKFPIWKYTPNNFVSKEFGTRAITLFNYKTLNVVDGAARAEQLNESGQFLVINPYTGRLVESE